jgi:hypothetical protein
MEPTHWRASVQFATNNVNGRMAEGREGKPFEAISYQDISFRAQFHLPF